MNNFELNASLPALAELSSRKLRPSAAWKIAKTLKAVEEALSPVEQVKRRLIIQYAIVDSVGNTVVLPENVQAWNEAIAELMQQELDFKHETVSVADLGDDPISPAILADLHWFISEE